LSCRSLLLPAMAVSAALATVCPAGAESHVSGDSELITLICSDAVTVRCHSGLLRARCPGLELEVPINSDAAGQKAVRVVEESSVLLALLRWVYAGKAAQEHWTADHDHVFYSRTVRLAKSWGMRDAGELQDCLTGGRKKRKSSLEEDVLAGYTSGILGGHFLFHCPLHDDSKEVLLDGGLPCLLRTRSDYFGAMLGGSWAESACVSEEPRVVTVYWPRDQMARLLHFLHGADFVVGPQDLRVALDCASFFGVPSLLHHVREWIASNLQVSTAPLLWDFVDSEPLLKQQDIEGCEDAEDVEAACFEYHVKHFSALAGIKEWEAFGDDFDGSCDEEVPLHNLSIPLLHRLLMSGLVQLPTKQLFRVVERFARAKCSDASSQEAFAQVFTALIPPAVIFNRDCRSAILQTRPEMTATAVVAF